MYELDRKAIDTGAGQYTVVWYVDEDATQPEDEGFVLAVDGWDRYASASRIDIKHGDAGDEVWNVLNTHGRRHEDSWEWELRSGAALVRYLTLKGHKAVTLVDRDYQPVVPSIERHRRIHGVAWAPSDVTDDHAEEYVKGDLDQWRAWAQGDCFGWVLKDPAGEEIDAVWGYYDVDGEREETLTEAVDAARGDAERRVEQANMVGAGIVGLI